MNTMLVWGEENNAEWEHYFLYANLNRITQHIRDGLISPWIVLNCNSGRKMLTKLNTEQIEIISTVLDPDHWNRRFKGTPGDLELVKEIIKEAKIP